MTANPRYGALGIVAVPFFWVFELVGPLLQALGYLMIPVAVALGVLDARFLIAFVVAAIALGVLLSIAALVLEEISFRRHARHREAARLLLYAVLDNLGYRQVTDFYRLLGTVDLVRRTGGWGEMKRRGIGSAEREPGEADQAILPRPAAAGVE